MGILKQADVDPLCIPGWGKVEQLRYRSTQPFIAKYMPPSTNRILDIGSANPMGRKLASSFSCEYWHTCNDLDSLDWSISSDGDSRLQFRVVFCLEVLEHLLNPLLFLRLLRDKLADDARVFLSFPSRPHFLWSHAHFHEYDRKRFEYLVKMAGYRIVAHERSARLGPEWSDLFRGIRPLMKAVLGLRVSLYCLEKDQQ